jgi:hypothetical protein
MLVTAVFKITHQCQYGAISDITRARHRKARAVCSQHMNEESAYTSISACASTASLVTQYKNSRQAGFWTQMKWDSGLRSTSLYLSSILTGLDFLNMLEIFKDF